MYYPILQYSKNESGSSSVFHGLNRTENAQPGEWLGCENLDTAHYPCIAPRSAHSAPITADGIICAAAEPSGSGEYRGITGIMLSDECIDSAGNKVRNFCFVYNGEVRHVGQEPKSASDKVTERTALWLYDTEADNVSADDTDGFNSALQGYLADYENNRSERVEWTVALIGSRYVINGYDSVLKRGKYFVFDTKKLYDSGSLSEKILERTVVPSDEQVLYSSLEFGTKTVNGEKLCYIINRDKSNKLSSVFSEGDYLRIKGTANGYNDINPYAEYGSDKKYAAVREIEESSMGDGSFYRETMYYYVTRANGKFVSNTSQTSQNVYLGVFVPPMRHIAVFGRHVWGVNPEENSVYASVFDTPFKLMNTDTQLDNSMSWQAALGVGDEALGVVPAGSEVLVMMKNSIIRLNGTSASSFMMTGIFKNCGCIDINSCAECAGTVFYLGRNGFYSYDGSQPKIISGKLNCMYSSAVSYCDGVKYYASAIRSDGGGHEFLVYDIERGIWHKWSKTPVIKDFFTMNGSAAAVYNTDRGNVITLCGGGAEEWSCESVNHYEGTNLSKGVNELWIRAETAAPVRIFTSVNGGAYKEHKALEPKGRMFMYKIPVRFNSGDFWSYKLTGAGECVIQSIERVYDEGGGRHYAY